MSKGKARPAARPPRRQKPLAVHGVAEKFQLALANHQQGMRARAEALYREILQVQPRYFDALLFLGYLYLETGNMRAAEELTRKALAVNPRHAAAHFNLGVALMNSGRFEDAVASFDQAITLLPNYAEAFNNRGSALQYLGRLPEAIASFDQAIKCRTNDDKAHNNRGVALQKLERHEEAIASFDRALEFGSSNGAVFNNRGISLMNLRRYEEAIADFDRAIGLVSDYFEAFLNRSLALRYSGRAVDALASIDRAVELDPASALAHSHRGLVLLKLGRYPDALAGLDRAIELDPACFEAFNNRGNVLEDLNRYDEALASYGRALAIRAGDPDAHLNTALCLLRAGTFDRAWQELEWRWQTDRYKTAKRGFPQPLWLGEESLRGSTILLHAEQGFGDTIQFCRYAKPLAALGATVLLEVQPGLEPALAGVEGISRLLTRGEPLPAFDYHCPLLSLPLAFKTELGTIPAEPRYLHSDPVRRAAWQIRLGDKTRARIGLVWSGSPGFANDRNRSIPLGDFVRLVSRPAQFVSLQKDVRDADLPILAARRDIECYADDLRDFGDTAALVDSMDLIVTVDTAVAHLAGALGRPVWLMLPFNADWRWLLNRDDSPWYPSVRLFRQPRCGDWATVIERVAAEFAAADFS